MSDCCRTVAAIPMADDRSLCIKSPNNSASGSNCNRPNRNAVRTLQKGRDSL